MINKLKILFAEMSEQKLVILLFVMALVIRLGVSLNAYVNIRSDDPELFNNLYYLMALDIVEQGKIFYETDDAYKDVVGPVMPWIIALSIFLFGNNWLGIFFITSLASALIVLFIVKLCLLLFERSVAILAGIWSAFSPLYLLFVPSAGKDLWMAFFLIFMLYYLIKMFGFTQYSLTRFIVFTVAFVVSIHLDERYVMFAPIFFFYILYSETDSFRIPAFSKTGLFTLLVILLMLPWAIRNYNKYDRIVLLTTRTERITDKLFGHEPRENVLDHAYGTDLYYIHDYQIDSVLRGLKTRTDGGFRIPEGQRKAMESGDMPKHFDKFEAFWSRFKTMYKPFQIGGVWERTGYYFYEKSLAHNLSSALFYGIMLIFSFPGFYWLFNQNRQVFYLFISVILVYSAIHLLTIPYTVWRYRLPLDSIFIVTGSYGLISVLKRFGLFRKVINS